MYLEKEKESLWILSCSKYTHDKNEGWHASIYIEVLSVRVLLLTDPIWIEMSFWAWEMKNVICLISVFLAITREAKYELRQLDGYFCTADFDIVLVILIIKLYIQFVILMNQSGNSDIDGKLIKVCVLGMCN
jgi:cbb3-type cytochrome oxidase subunit 1